MSQISPVKIGEYLVGPGYSTVVVAELGVNHSGSLDIARKLIAAAAMAGAHFVKFQKRTLAVVYTDAELDQPRVTPAGTTNRQWKEALEFGYNEYAAINQYCQIHGIPFTASPWDEAAVDFLEQFAPPFYKVASASLTDADLLRHIRSMGRPIVMSTGMSTLEEIDAAVACLGTDDLVLMHCNSTYPAPVAELNLRCIPMLAQRYGVPVGYSGHETGLPTTLAAVALGACLVERHLTLDRASYGTDQSASVEPFGFAKLVRDIRAVDMALGDASKRVWPSEEPVKAKLRRVNTLLPTEAHV